MKNVVWIFVWVGILFSSYAQAQELFLLPYPQRIERGSSEFRIDSTFYLHISDKIDSNLKHYVYWAGIRMARQTNKMLVLDLHEDSTYSRRGVWIFFDEIQEPCVKANEGYRIEVNKSIVKVCASTSMGTMRALETLTQLLSKDEKGFYFPSVVIEDKPDYPWRGLLIDVARHFIPLPVLYRNIDAMAMAKMNVLHLHLTEDQAFRIESKKYPALHEKGSNGQYYTQAEMRRFVEYASDRGVRVVPEFDMPGHTTSWLVGYPELGSVAGATYSVENKYGVFNPTFDPTNEKVYEFLDVFIHEMASVFKDTCFHIGGDEVTGVEWQNNPKIQQFMEVNKMKDAHDLQAYFNQRIEKIVRSCGKRMVGWDEVLECSPSANTVIQFWRGSEYLENGMQKGYDVVRSNGYYLDQTYTAGEYYMRRSENKRNVTNDSLGHLMGFEACMWSELVDSITIDSRIWPNAAAIAELGWNASMPSDTIKLYKRLIPFSERCTNEGLHQETYIYPWIQTLNLGKEEDEIQLICAYLKPVSDYTRHKLIKNNSGYNSSVPLNTIADMARPCSEEYLKFVVLVEGVIADENGAKDKLMTVLNACIHQHEVLQRRLHNDKSLSSWMDLSSQLASTGRIGMHLMKKDASEKNKILEEIKVLEEKQKNDKGYTSAILPVLKKWAERLN